MTFPVVILILLTLVFVLMVALAVELISLILRLNKLNLNVKKEIDHIYSQLEKNQKEICEIKQNIDSMSINI